jgi:hypothetical protein
MLLSALLSVLGGALVRGVLTVFLSLGTVLAGGSPVAFALKPVDRGRLAVLCRGRSPRGRPRPRRDQVGTVLGRPITIPAPMMAVDCRFFPVSRGPCVPSLGRVLPKAGCPVPGFSGTIPRLGARIREVRARHQHGHIHIDLVQQLVPAITDRVTTIRRPIPLISETVPLIRDPVPLISSAVSFVSLAVSPVGRRFGTTHRNHPVRTSITPGGCAIGSPSLWAHQHGTGPRLRRSLGARCTGQTYSGAN